MRPTGDIAIRLAPSSFPDGAKFALLKRLMLVLVALQAMQPAACLATNGLIAPGNGAVQLGLAGAGTALADDSDATLRNPAAGAWIGNAMSLNLGIVLPRGGYNASPVGSGSSAGLLDLVPGRQTSVRGVFPVPSFSRNWRIADHHAVGIGVSAGGLKSLSHGAHANFARGVPTFAAQCSGGFGGGPPVSGTLDLRNFCGNSGSALGVDLAQLFVSGYWAWRPVASLSIGLGPVGLLQRIEIRGIGAFAGFSNYPTDTTDNHHESSVGIGARVGVLWQPAERLSLGLAYQSRTRSTPFHRYRGPIIGGSVNMPPIIDAGLRLRTVGRQQLLLDVEQIRYHDIKPLGAHVEPQRFADHCFVPRAIYGDNSALAYCLGGNHAPGFGWDNMTVYKAGYQAEMGRLTVRGGFSYGRNPVGDGQIISAAFAPAVTERHATLGLSWRLSRTFEFDWALVRALKHHVVQSNAMSNANLQLLGSTPITFGVASDPDDQRIDTYIDVWQIQFGMRWSLD